MNFFKDTQELLLFPDDDLVVVGRRLSNIMNDLWPSYKDKMLTH